MDRLIVKRNKLIKKIMEVYLGLLMSGIRMRYSFTLEGHVNWFARMDANDNCKSVWVHLGEFFIKQEDIDTLENWLEDLKEVGNLIYQEK